MLHFDKLYTRVFHNQNVSLHRNFFTITLYVTSYTLKATNIMCFILKCVVPYERHASAHREGEG